MLKLLLTVMKLETQQVEHLQQELMQAKNHITQSDSISILQKVILTLQVTILMYLEQVQTTTSIKVLM